MDTRKWLWYENRLETPKKTFSNYYFYIFKAKHHLFPTREGTQAKKQVTQLRAQEGNQGHKTNANANPNMNLKLKFMWLYRFENIYLSDDYNILKQSLET